jgi:hypothetical protein
MSDHFSRRSLACAFLLALSACGGAESDAGEAAPPADASMEARPEGSDVAPSGAAAEPSSTVTAPVTADDIDRWQKGMGAELEAVRAAGARMKEAKTNDDTLSAMMAVQETSTQEVGARATGMELERYKFVSSELSAAVSYLTPHLGGIDTTMLSPAQRTELRESNEAQLKQMEERVPPQVVEALRPRAPALRKQSLELVGERLRSAGLQ